MSIFFLSACALQPEGINVTWTLSGNCPSGATINIKLGGSSIGGAACDEGQVELPAIGLGTYTLVGELVSSEAVVWDTQSTVVVEGQASFAFTAPTRVLASWTVDSGCPTNGRVGLSGSGVFMPTGIDDVACSENSMWLDIVSPSSVTAILSDGASTFQTVQATSSALPSRLRSVRRARSLLRGRSKVVARQMPS